VVATVSKIRMVKFLRLGYAGDDVVCRGCEEYGAWTARSVRVEIFKISSTMLE
jgi:hypothetical protein